MTFLWLSARGGGGGGGGAFESLESLEISAIPRKRDETVMFIPKGHTRIKILTFKISVVLCSIAKGTSEMFQLERE